MNVKAATFAIGGAAAAYVAARAALSSGAVVSVDGKTCLITGGGSGVGRLTALAFAKKGCSVVLWDLNVDGMRETERMIRNSTKGVECTCQKVDVSSPETVYRAASELQSKLATSGRRVQILVNNAGIVSGKSLLDTEDSRIQKTFDVNCLAHFWTTKAFLPGMIEARYGHIVTVASVAGLTASPQMIDYAASKHAAVGFASGLRKELKQMGLDFIGTSLICPAHISTNLFKGFEQPLFGSLSPAFVASQILDAVERRREMIVMPKLSDPRLLQALVPTWAVDKIGSALGLDGAMKNFDPKQANSVISKIGERALLAAKSRL
eukprot:g232.t1